MGPVSCVACRALHRVPLDETWKAAAQKELKGKDVDKTLTWKTPEVIHSLLANKWRAMNNISLEILNE